MAHSPPAAMLHRLLCFVLVAICASLAGCAHALEIRPATGFGRFQATLENGTLKATLKVHYQFERGLVHLAPGFHPDAYRWTEDARQAFKAAFEQQAHDGWSHQFPLESPNGAETVEVDLQVVETRHREDSDWVIYAYHYPDDAPHVDASVCDIYTRHYATPEAPCLTNDATLRWGTLSIASHHILADAVSPAEFEAITVYFDKGKHTIEAWGDGYVPVMLHREEALSLITHGTTHKGWWVSLVGAAGGRESPGGSPDDTEPSIQLARQRMDTVQKYLIGQGVPAEQFHRVAAGQFSDEGAGPSALDGWVKVTIQPYPFKTVPHEIGHMIGLPDESKVSREANSPDTLNAFKALAERYLFECRTKEEADNVMSLGTRVKARHYLPFLQAINALDQDNLEAGETWGIVGEPQVDCRHPTSEPADADDDTQVGE